MSLMRCENCEYTYDTDFNTESLVIVDGVPAYCERCNSDLWSQQ